MSRTELPAMTRIERGGAGEPLPFTLMTTSQNEKTPKEALWFAFYNAVLPDDLDDEMNAVVIVVDSDSLAVACKAWVTENQE
jgi:hypothetical protein